MKKMKTLIPYKQYTTEAVAEHANKMHDIVINYIKSKRLGGQK